MSDTGNQINQIKKIQAEKVNQEIQNIIREI